MSIERISFLIYLRPVQSRNRLQILGMEPGSSSLLLRCHAVADPGHGSRVLLLRGGGDPGHGSRVLLPRCGQDPGHGNYGATVTYILLHYRGGQFPTPVHSSGFL
jgi:hypothetical protein